MTVVDLLFGLLAPPCCAACDVRLSREAAFCAACVATLERPPALPHGTTASFAYGGAIGEAIRSAKYEGRVDRLRALRRLVIERLPARASIDLVVPVPLHVTRLRERGFDQAGVLARAVGEALDRPVSYDRLERIVATGHLAQLDAASRKKAVHEAFRARHVRGARVLLVDDVRTTGATLDAAASAIEAAGGIARAHVLAATPKA